MSSSRHGTSLPGLPNGHDIERSSSPVEGPQNDRVSPMIKIVVKPNEELKSPFLVKRHLFLDRPDPTILDGLYNSIIGSSRQVWVPGELLQEAVKSEGWRHYVHSNWMQYINDPNNLRTEYSREATLYDPSGSHLVFIPVLHDDHWTLYAFNMSDKKLCILDSRRDASEGGDQDPVKRHQEIRKLVCSALNITVDFNVNFLSWKYEFPKVPKQQKSCDSGFFVFNFMRFWDGHRLLRWFSTETMELRKNFIAFILSSENNHAAMPPDVSEWIKKLPGDTRMNPELLKAAWASEADKFRELLTDPAPSAGSSTDNASARSDHQHQPSRPARCSCVHFPRVSSGSYCLCLECMNHQRRADEQANETTDRGDGDAPAGSTVNGDRALNPGDPSPTDGRNGTNNAASAIAATPTTAPCPPIWQVTADGNGVLHIAARFGIVQPVLTAISEWTGGPDIAKALLQAGNNKGDRPLHHAVTTGSKDTVKFIVDKARTIMGSTSDTFAWFLRAKNMDGQTCLHEAVQLGHQDVVEYLVSEDATLGFPSPSRHVPLPLVQIVDNKGISPLYLATTLHSRGIIEALIKKNVPPVIPSYFGPAGKTALHAAVFFSKGFNKILVDWNPSLIKIPDDSGSTPLHYLAVGYVGRRSRSPFGYYSVVRKLKSTYMISAVTELLLEKDPSSGYCEDSEGSLPIHIAAANGMVGIINQFIKRSPGCQLSRNASGQTILHVAVQMGESDVVQHVCSDIHFRNTLNMKDNDGNTALHLAAQKGCSRTFGILMGCRDVGLSIINKNGHTPLDLAVLNRTSRFMTYWPGNYHWIGNSLLAAGASFGVFRGDRFSSEIPERTKADNEALSETMSKSAAIMATCAGLLFNAALNIFLNVESVHPKKTDNPATQDKLVRSVKRLSGSSLSISASAILLFAIAGFPILPSIVGRAYALTLGLGVLIFSSMRSLEALAARLHLAKTTGAGMAIFCIFLSLFCIALCGSLMRKILQHARPIWARTRSGRLCVLLRCIYGTHTHQSYSNIPSLHFLVLMEVLMLTYLIVHIGVRIAMDNWS